MIDLPGADTDIDANLPGIQADCQVEERFGTGATSIPPCSDQSGACGPCPCWRAVPEDGCAGLADRYSLEVVRSQPAAGGTTVQASCLGPSS